MFKPDQRLWPWNVVLDQSWPGPVAYVVQTRWNETSSLIAWRNVLA